MRVVYARYEEFIRADGMLLRVSQALVPLVTHCVRLTKQIR